MLNGTIDSLSNKTLYDVRQSRIYEHRTSNCVGSITLNTLSINKERFTFSGKNVMDSNGTIVFRIHVQDDANPMGVLVLLAIIALIFAIMITPLYFSLTDFNKVDFVNKLVCKIKKKKYVKPKEKVWTDFGKKIRKALLVASILPVVIAVLTFIIPAMIDFGFQLAFGIAVACLVARYFLFKKKKELILVVADSENDSTTSIHMLENEKINRCKVGECPTNQNETAPAKSDNIKSGISPIVSETTITSATDETYNAPNCDRENIGTIIETTPKETKSQYMAARGESEATIIRTTDETDNAPNCDRENIATITETIPKETKSQYTAARVESEATNEQIIQSTPIDDKSQHIDKFPEKFSGKINKKTILIIASICLLLIVVSVGAFLRIKQPDKTAGTTSKIESSELAEPSNTIKSEISSDDILGNEPDINGGDIQVNEPEVNGGDATVNASPIINFNNYVGYWNIIRNQEKELTIHYGEENTVFFSLWYYGKNEIKDASAQLKGNIASFSTEIDGREIKGKLIFKETSITVHITHSMIVNIPVEIMEFEERHLTSWEYREENSNSLDLVENPNNFETVDNIGDLSNTNNITDDPVENPNDFETVDNIGNSSNTNNITEFDYPNSDEEYHSSFDNNTEPNLQVQLNQSPHLFKVTSEGHYIYSRPDYNSETTQILSLGTYTITEEQFDMNGNIWGKLKSGAGWICLEETLGYKKEEEQQSFDYILPSSADRLLTEEDIASLTKEELRIAKNEIYARHGRLFNDKSLQEYFNSKSWYTGYIPGLEFSESVLNNIELANISFIGSHEQ